MHVVILDVGAPDQVMEDVSNEVIDDGDNHGDVDSMSVPGNEVQTDSTTSKEPAKTADVTQPPETSTVTNPGGLIVPGPSGTKAKVNSKAEEPSPAPEKSKRKPFKPNGKELVGDRPNKTGNGKKTDGKVKGTAKFQARVELPTVNPNRRWICGWANCQQTNRPIDNICWNCSGNYGSRGDYNDRPLPNDEPDYVWHEGYGAYRGRGGGRGGNRYSRGPGSHYTTRGRGHANWRGGRKGK